MIFKRKSKTAGLTLIELMLAVGIIAVAMIGILEYMERDAQRQRAELAGEQLALVGKAVEKLIAQEGTNFKLCLAANQVITIPMSILYTNGGTTTVGTCQINNRPYYAWNNVGNPINSFGSNYVIDIKNQLNGYITGLVTLDAPVREGNFGTNIRYDWLGLAAKKIGANGGGTFVMTGANRMNGVGGGWSITNADFPAVAQLGILGYKTGAGGDMDNLYLRLDGAYPMRGDINVGNFSVNNVTDLNVNGWINGNNALINNLKTSYIAANHVQTNTLNATTAITTGNRDATIRPIGWSNDVVKGWNFLSDGGAFAAVRTPGGTQIGSAMDKAGRFEGGGFYFNDLNAAGSFSADGRGSYIGWLKDRLPRYVLRGVYVVDSYASVSKPTCQAAVSSTGMGNRAKIIVTPMSQNTYPDYDVDANLTSDNWLVLSRTVTAVDQLQTYAIDMGTYWEVRVSSAIGDPMYGGAATPQGVGLVQVFCDFGD